MDTESTIVLKVIYLSCPTYRTHHESFILKLGTGEGSHDSNPQRCNSISAIFRSRTSSTMHKNYRNKGRVKQVKDLGLPLSAMEYGELGTDGTFILLQWLQCTIYQTFLQDNFLVNFVNQFRQIFRLPILIQLNQLPQRMEPLPSHRQTIVHVNRDKENV
jgi:hypothetical protein